MTTTALIVIDIQNDLFPGGACLVPDIEETSSKARILLDHFRKTQDTIIHIKHIELDPNAESHRPNTKGAEIHDSVRPVAGEPVVQKNFPNGFRQTNLLELLKSAKVSTIVFCGAMSNMCVEATVRAAFGLGFSCIVAEDACAASDITFKGCSLSGREVHAAYMGSLAQGYARVVTVDEFLKEGTCQA